MDTRQRTPRDPSQDPGRGTAAAPIAGLPDGLSRFEFVRLAREIGSAGSWTPALIEHLDLLLSWTRAQDWEPGARPVVWLSVNATAARLGVDTSTIRNHERALKALGAISVAPAGNRRRCVHRREDGTVTWAYGVELAPLLAILPRLEQEAAEQRERVALFQQARAEASGSFRTPSGSGRPLCTHSTTASEWWNTSRGARPQRRSAAFGRRWCAGNGRSCGSSADTLGHRIPWEGIMKRKSFTDAMNITPQPAADGAMPPADTSLARRVIPIALAEIHASDRRRPVDPEQVQVIAESIGEIGLQSPIAVRLDPADTAGYRLVAGAHRIAAAAELGWTRIDGLVVDGSDDELALMEIDENLARAEPTPLDRALFLAERKAIFERVHPPPKRGRPAVQAGNSKMSGNCSPLLIIGRLS